MSLDNSKLLLSSDESNQCIPSSDSSQSSQMSAATKNLPELSQSNDTTENLASLSQVNMFAADSPCHPDVKLIPKQSLVS